MKKDGVSNVRKSPTSMCMYTSTLEVAVLEMMKRKMTAHTAAGKAIKIAGEMRGERHRQSTSVYDGGTLVTAPSR